MYDLGSADQTINSSPFYMMWVVGLEMQITIGMSRFPVHFHAQFWISLHDQNVHEWKGIISFNFHCEFQFPESFIFQNNIIYIIKSVSLNFQPVMVMFTLPVVVF
jgi:hypothetical protein